MQSLKLDMWIDWQVYMDMCALYIHTHAAQSSPDWSCGTLLLCLMYSI